jgi:hypothetical protein
MTACFAGGGAALTRPPNITTMELFYEVLM